MHVVIYYYSGVGPAPHKCIWYRDIDQYLGILPQASQVAWLLFVISFRYLISIVDFPIVL